MLEANKRCNEYVCYCLLMCLLLGRKKGQGSRGKKPSEQFGSEKQEIGSSGRVDFQFRPDAELCVGHIFVINGFTQSYLCGLYWTGILVKWIHNMH
jgi:hypothetical protein